MATITEAVAMTTTRTRCVRSNPVNFAGHFDIFHLLPTSYPSPFGFVQGFNITGWGDVTTTQPMDSQDSNTLSGVGPLSLDGNLVAQPRKVEKVRGSQKRQREEKLLVAKPLVVQGYALSM